MFRFRLPYLLLTFVCISPCIIWGQGKQFHFRLNNDGETIAEITASAPGSSWSVREKEAALARVSVDGQYNQEMMVFGNERPSTYHVCLGYLKSGEHTMSIVRDDHWSAPDAGLHIQNARVTQIRTGSPEFEVVEHAPILYARADTLGNFSDAPLLMWYEVFKLPEGEAIQYSIVFSNEDGGTRTDALMARWGRATDIEYIYRVTLDNQDRIQKEVFLGIDEKPHPFHGRKQRLHPFILDATPNNDFTDTGYSPIKYRFMPVYADLSHHSREELMDRFPWTYRVMGEELEREQKLRPFGTTEGTKVSDPRNYLYLEMNAENQSAGLIAWVKLKGSERWYSSDRGRLDLVITRRGWYRTTIELPPGTAANSIQYLALECVDMSPLDLLEENGNKKPTAKCELEDVSKAFQLDSKYRPGKTLFEIRSPVTFSPGEMVTFLPDGERAPTGAHQTP